MLMELKENTAMNGMGNDLAANEISDDLMGLVVGGISLHNRLFTVGDLPTDGETVTELVSEKMEETGTVETTPHFEINTDFGIPMFDLVGGKM